MVTNGRVAKPEIVTADEWQKARDELLVAEKEITRAQDELAARRRRLPMVKFENKYEFDAPDGKKTLLDLFGEHDQLILYQFMDNGPENYCPGCTWWTMNMPQNTPEMLAEKGIAWAHVSNMPIEQIEQYKEKLGWTMPFVSSFGTSFSDDCGAGPAFLLNVFLRDGEDIYRTYTTTARGYERLAFVTGLLDLTVYGRQENWEKSPEGWPQHDTYLQPTTMDPHHVATGYGTFK
jgi:predicted dithiol-disulfide oxidoreductase (DUF899 family)